MREQIFKLRFVLMNMKVYFARHGESEYNVDKLINTNPTIKIGLTEKGKRQAKKLGEKLSRKKIEIIFVSEFLRTQQTAVIANSFLHVKIKVDERINEPHFGFEGKRDAELKKKLRGNEIYFKLKGHESFYDSVMRVKRFLEWLAGQKYNSVLIIAHDWILRCADIIANDVEYKKGYKKEFKNCQILEIEI